MSIAKTVSRVNMEETARANVWAKIVNAVPFPCFCSTRARNVWPWALVRSNTTAAAEKAHVREAWPLFVHEVPSRVPADALAYVTRRQEDTQSWTRGKRWLWWMSSSRTRLQIVPTPGTVCRR